MEKDPIYEPNGKITIRKAVPFGLQHVLAMFVANIAPILIVAGAVKMDPAESAALVQSAMIVAGIGSLLQLFPIWRFGSGLPIIMGISFTFVSVACIIGTKYGYGAVLGAAFIGGILEGILGLGASRRSCLRPSCRPSVSPCFPSGPILSAAALAIQILVPRIT